MSGYFFGSSAESPAANIGRNFALRCQENLETPVYGVFRKEWRLPMCHPKQDPPNNLDEKNPEKRAFFESALKYMEELDEQAGDWRIHLPYEALLRYGEDSAVREQYEDHFNSCAYCQEAMKTLNR